MAKKKSNRRRNGNPKSNGAPPGAPNKYITIIKDNLLQIKELARHGFKDKEIANFYNVSEASINNYKIKFPEFLETLKRGKDDADNEVIKSLYTRATGYKYIEKHIEYAPPDGEGKDPKIKNIKEIKKVVPPDVVACIFWLKNRRRSEWGDVYGVQHELPFDFDSLTDAELDREIKKIKEQAGIV